MRSQSHAGSARDSISSLVQKPRRRINKPGNPGFSQEVRRLLPRVRSPNENGSGFVRIEMHRGLNHHEGRISTPTNSSHSRGTPSPPTCEWLLRLCPFLKDLGLHFGAISGSCPAAQIFTYNLTLSLTQKGQAFTRIPVRERQSQSVSTYINISIRTQCCYHERGNPVMPCGRCKE